MNPHLKNQKTRRNFLKSTLTGIAGTALLGTASATPGFTGSRKKKVGYALVGLGYYSTDLLAPALQETENAYLAGIVTGTPAKEKVWAEKYNIPAKNIYNYENFDSIAENPDIQVIYIVLPNSMHKEFTIRAAKAGKHVLCEKPMAMNAAECREMIQACEDNDVLLSIGYRLHYDPYNIEAMRLGQGEVYGKVNHISCGAAFHNSSTDHWKLQKEMGGGSMMDMGVYPLQAARYVTGEEPIAVTAQGYSMRDAYQDINEAVNLQLEFPGGTIANLSTGFHASFNYLLVSADRGWFELNLYSGYGGIKGRTKDKKLEFPKINQQAAHMDDFALSVNEGKTVRVPGEEGLKDMIVVDVTYKALKKNARVKI